jgi:hypothetical protein
MCAKVQLFARMPLLRKGNAMTEPRTAKSYWIVRHADQWQLCVGGQTPGILCSENRADLIKVACRLGAERGGAVFVFGERETVEARLSFHQGLLTIDGPSASVLAPELLSIQELVPRSTNDDALDVYPLASLSS